jgi:hypothetical protein
MGTVGATLLPERWSPPGSMAPLRFRFETEFDPVRARLNPGAAGPSFERPEVVPDLNRRERLRARSPSTAPAAS